MNPHVKPLVYLLSYFVVFAFLLVYGSIFSGLATLFGWDLEQTVLVGFVLLVVSLLNPSRMARESLTSHGIW